MEERLALSQQYGYSFETLISLLFLQEIYACAGNGNVAQSYWQRRIELFASFDASAIRVSWRTMGTNADALTAFHMGDRAALARHLQFVSTVLAIDDPWTLVDAITFSTLLLTSGDRLHVEAGVVTDFDLDSRHDRLTLAAEIVTMTLLQPNGDAMARGLARNILAMARSELGETEFSAAQRRGSMRNQSETVQLMLGIAPSNDSDTHVPLVTTPPTVIDPR
jgi:hypothetical protein